MLRCGSGHAVESRGRRASGRRPARSARRGISRGSRPPHHGLLGRTRRMTTQTWNTEGYEKNARFVTDLGAPVLALLAPRRGEHILDVGCGDGVLTKKISDLGCNVVGVDSSQDFVVSARELGLNV